MNNSNNIELLKERKRAIEAMGKDTREKLNILFDEKSFVELSAFGFSKDPENEGDEGVVTGFGTIGGYPFYIAAQNFENEFGALTKFNCDKIARLLSAAEKNEAPVIWMLSSRGVKLGEGIDVLEGVSNLLLKATRLKGTVLQYAILSGEVYGPAAAIASICDFVFFLKGSCVAISSPLVLSAKSNKNLKAEEVGGYDALKGASLPAVQAKDFEEISAHIRETFELVNIPVLDAELNASHPALNQKAERGDLKEIFESFLEVGQNSHPEVSTILGRIGGISVAAVAMEKMYINEGNLKKIKYFVDFACCHAIPLVFFVDCLGFEESLSANCSALLREIGEYLNILDATDSAKIAVVTGSAVGMGYSLFAAKSLGFDNTFALATSNVSLFESEKGANILYQGADMQNKEELINKYFAENADPVYAARGGYVDDIIEPQFIKQYLIASLEMLLR